jgi:protein disulfide-isomerase
MKIKLVLAALLSVFILTGTALADSASWHTDWETAASESKKTGKPILMDFTGSDWCGWCIKLKEEVFETAEFKTWADKNVVLLELDFPRKTAQPEKVTKQNEALAKKYGIQGFPTIIFAKADGKAIGKLGYEKGGPQVWTGKAADIID